VLNAELL